MVLVMGRMSFRLDVWIDAQNVAGCGRRAGGRLKSRLDGLRPRNPPAPVGDGWLAVRPDVGAARIPPGGAPYEGLTAARAVARALIAWSAASLPVVAFATPSC